LALAAIAIMIAVAVAIAVAALTGLLQFATSLFRLPAPFTVFADRLMQVRFRSLDAALAFVVPIDG
jgi:hypothetical protein